MSIFDNVTVGDDNRRPVKAHGAYTDRDFIITNLRASVDFARNYAGDRSLAMAMLLGSLGTIVSGLSGIPHNEIQDLITQLWEDNPNWNR
jgi:hypothetical protein